jgi:hypothetical protein
MTTTEQRRVYRQASKRSLCRGKQIVNPNRCQKVKTCKVARGTKRAYCRKKKATRYNNRTARKPYSGKDLKLI